MYGKFSMLLNSNDNCFNLTGVSIAKRVLISIAILYNCLGNYKQCARVAMETMSASAHVCSFICDVTGSVTMEIGIRAKMTASTEPSICDIKVR